MSACERCWGAANLLDDRETKLVKRSLVLMWHATFLLVVTAFFVLAYLLLSRSGFLVGLVCGLGAGALASVNMWRWRTMLRQAALTVIAEEQA